MKKIFSYILLAFVILFASGCFENKYVPNEGSITLSMPSGYKDYMLYEPPSFTLEFDGVLNTIDGIDYSYYTSFCHNDDLVLSAIIKDIFDSHEGRTYTVVEQVKRGNGTHLNRYIDEEYAKQTVFIDNSERFYETTYVLLENGLMLCFTYCKFSADGEVIYRFRETKNIEMIAMYPLMVIEKDGEKKFVITPLPFLVKNKVSASSTKNAQSIMGSDDYIAYPDRDASSYYVYDYPALENSKEFCINFYKDYFDVEVLDDEGTLEYMGCLFSLHFYDDYFTIRPKSIN